MACLIKKTPKSKNWTCCYTAADGRRVKVSTKEPDHDKAMSICLSYAHAEGLARKGKMTEQAARRIIAEILERATGEGLSGFTAEQWLNEWLEGKRDTKSPKTVDRYEQVVRDFRTSLGDRAALSVEAITAKDVIAFRRGILARDRANKTANNAVKIIRTAFNSALRLGHVTANPCAALEDLNEDTAEREAFTPAQVSKLIESAESADWKGAIAFAYYTAARLGDVANVLWSMVDLAAGVVRFTPKKTKRKKIEVIIPLHPTLWAMLSKRQGVGLAPVFPSLAGKGTGGVNGLSAQFAAIMAAAEIKGTIIQHTKKGRRNTTLSFHSLRHSFTSGLANAGVDRELRMKMTGHTKKETHAQYTHHDIEVLRAAVVKLPAVSS